MTVSSEQLERLKKLSSAKRALFIKTMQEKAARATESKSIARRQKQESYPLSFAQLRLWFLDQLEPGNAFYNLHAAMRLSGALNVAALERSLNEIVRRHESLRTIFVAENGQPVQKVIPPPTLEVPVIDLRESSAGGQKVEIKRLSADEAQLPFDLTRGPLLRMKLLELGEQEHVVLLTTHHIVSDGWSMNILVRELAALYDAFSLERTSPLAELPIQYADFALWQREWLSGDLLASELAYWKRQLSGAPPVLNLPTDRKRPAVQSFRGAVITSWLPGELTKKLVALGRAEDATLFMTLLAAFQTLLYRYTQQEDLVVGTPVAGRNRSEVEGLIGFFVNTLPLRARLSGDPTFRELLRRVRESVLDAQAHQDLPFEKLVEELHPERSLSYSPLFQVMFALRNTPMSGPEGLAGLRLDVLEVESRTAKFDLTLEAVELDGSLRLSFEYNSDLFEAATISRMAAHFRALLDAVATSVLYPISAVPLLTVPELDLLAQWNDTFDIDTTGRCLHQLFEAQVERTPDAVALVFDDERVTYAELNGRANQLAHLLLSRGVRAETLVGICLERSVEMVVAILGTLKAGAAYVPLDPRYPRQRLAYMLEDAAAPVLLSQRSLLKDLPKHHAQLIRLDVDWQALLAQQSRENPLTGASAENLAYVIYTSGSTGQPKGVAITHRSAVVLLGWAETAYTGAQLAGVLAATSICFDLSIFELFAPLSVGGKVILAADALALPTLKAAHEVTLINSVPSAMAELLRVNGVPESVETVNLAGEVLKNALVRQIHQQTKATKVWNLYGPTEDTTYSTAAVTARGAAGEPTIGRPISNTTVHILDGSMQRVPIGISGEIYLGGDGLARGYLNRPEITAERFVPDPFGTRAGTRLYRTGDVGRYLDNGEIDYQGRRDHQVKVRGFRIELGEIEAALTKQDGVREAVVLTREDEGGGTRLVAYVAAGAEGPGASDAGRMRRELAERLPEYMIPAAFVFMEELPLTPNGKVDRKALPEPGRPEPRGSVVPRTEVEAKLAEIWGAVLHVGPVGAEDNFFDLGGHSLLATQVISRLRETFGVELPLRSLFANPTVAGLAQRVEDALRAGETNLTQTIERVSRDAPLPLSFAQQRLWFVEQLNPAQPIYNIAVVVRLKGALNVHAMEESLNQLVRRHETLRTVFATVDGTPIQVIQPSSSLLLPLMKLKNTSAAGREEEVRRRASEEQQRPFNLEQGPLLRALLFKFDDEEHVLQLTMHHIVSDGWSMGVLMREVAVFYEATCKGEPAVLPEMQIQYADFAYWQRKYLQGEVMEKRLQYWRRQLAGIPTELSLPTDYPRPAVRSYRGKYQVFTLPAALSNALRTLSRREGVTLFMTLLAGFQTLLHRHAEQDDIVVGADVANRNRAETEGLIGFFVNMMVMRADFSADPSFSDLLKQVREAALEAYAHQDVPFDRLVEELQPERTLSITPLFQVVFVLQNTPMPPLELPGLELELLEVESGTVQFDLILSMHDVGEELTGALTYNTDLFEADTIARLLKNFQTLLESIVNAPGRKISDLGCFTDEEMEGLDSLDISGLQMSRKDLENLMLEIGNISTE